MNPDLITTDRIIGNKYEIENKNPWGRKTIWVPKYNARSQLLENSEILEPRAIVADNHLYFHFVVESRGVATLMEVDGLDGSSYEIDKINHNGSACFDKANPMYNGLKLEYNLSCETKTRTYVVGSKQSFTQSSQDGHGKEQVKYNLTFQTFPSPTGRYIAAAYQNNFAPSVYEEMPELYRLVTGATPGHPNGTNPKDNRGGGMADEDTGVLLYDKLSKTREVMFRQAYSGDWSIGRFAWSHDEDELFFDNFGAVACIWRFDLHKRLLQKIVPEHGAKEPFPFVFEGTEYIVYADTISDLQNRYVGILKVARQN